MLVLIRDELVNPPTWIMSFRDLTLWLVVFRHDEIVIESVDPDPYYRWLKQHGSMDFVSDFVRPGVESGIRLDRIRRTPVLPRTVIVDRIIPENVERILADIDFFRPPPDEFDEYRSFG